MSGDLFFNNDNQAPAIFGVSVTPDDNNDLAQTSRAIWVGGAGNLNVDMYGKLNVNSPLGPVTPNTVLLSGIQAGTLLPIAVRRVRSTNTTATLIVALY